MVDFRVGTAVHATAHAVAWAHAPQATLGQAVALLPVGPGETCLFEHRAAGFSHAVPGHPRALPIPGDPHEPLVDAVIGLGDLPVSVRYRLDRPPIAARSAYEYAMMAAHAYGAQRASHGFEPQAVRSEQLLLWGVEAGARGRYALAVVDGYGADTEDLVVLVRGGYAFAIACRYAADGIDWLRLALLRSALLCNLAWGGRVSTTIWPASDFLEPGFFGALVPHRRQLAADLAPTVSITDEEKDAVSSALSRIISGPEPPWYRCAAAFVHDKIEGLRRLTSNAAVHQILVRGSAEVVTMHDLRGLCVLLGQVVSQRVS